VMRVREGQTKADRSLQALLCQAAKEVCGLEPTEII